MKTSISYLATILATSSKKVLALISTLEKEELIAKTISKQGMILTLTKRAQVLLFSKHPVPGIESQRILLLSNAYLLNLLHLINWSPLATDD